VNSGRQLLTLSTPSLLLYDVTFSTDSRRLATLGGEGDHKISIWDLTSGHAVSVLATNVGPDEVFSHQLGPSANHSVGERDAVGPGHCYGAGSLSALIGGSRTSRQQAPQL
jgi:hypothetical protein